MLDFEVVVDNGNLLYIDDINMKSNATGINSFANNTAAFANVYPNPTSSSANLQFQLRNACDNATVIVTDITGKIVSTQAVGSVGTTIQTLNINTESLNTGMYFVKLVSDNTELLVQKLSVVK